MSQLTREETLTIRPSTRINLLTQSEEGHRGAGSEIEGPLQLRPLSRQVQQFALGSADSSTLKRSERFMLVITKTLDLRPQSRRRDRP